MMSKTGIKTDATAMTPGPQQAPDGPPMDLSEEDRSKDDFFVKIAEISEAMIDRHGKDFAMGALILSARFIAEGRPLTKRKN